jgi:hypothetical protein
MFKKGIVLLLLLAVSATGAVFAQEDDATDSSGGSSGIKHWISGEASLLGIGGRYEYMLTDNISIGGNIFFNSFFLFWNAFGITVTGRYYFWKGLYGELGLGYGWGSGTDDWFYHINGFMIAPAVGFKIDFDEPGGFFICPMLSVPFIIGVKKQQDLGWLTVGGSRTGVNVNIKAGIGLGYAF